MSRKKPILSQTDDELEERAALIAEGCKVSQDEGLRMAKEQREEAERKTLGNRAWKQGALL